MERNARFELTVHSFLPTMETGSGHETHLCIPLRPVMSMVLRDIPKLMDEPTSNLDSLNEAVILRALREERGGKTVVLVSHRQSTMRIADTVYSVEHGRMS